MAIREKIKAKFSRSKTTAASDIPRLSLIGQEFYTGRKDIEYYKPSEIPKSKYGRGKVDKEHKERLDAYSFTDAFQVVQRKSSFAMSGTFSPGGSKSLSTAPSAAVSRRASWTSRNGSEFSTAATSEMSRDLSRTKLAAHDSDKISENSVDDTDVTNTGLSRRASCSGRPIVETNLDSQLEQGDAPQLRLDRQATTSPRPASLTNDTPFTMEELERAMTKATVGRETTPPMAVAVAAA